MIRYINSNGGSISLGKLNFSWQNTDDEFKWAGYTVISWGDTCLEFGEIDNGNGIFLTRYEDGDIAYTRTFVRI